MEQKGAVGGLFKAAVTQRELIKNAYYVIVFLTYYPDFNNSSTFNTVNPLYLAFPYI